MAESVPKKQHTIEYVAIGALVAVALIIGIARFRKGDNDDEVFSRKEFNEKWKAVDILEANVPGKENEVISAIEDNELPFKSPFDDMVEKKVAEDDTILLPAMQFQGMIWKSSRPQAIIDDKVYDVKDIITMTEGVIEVRAINKDGIHLIFKNKEFIVRPK